MATTGASTSGFDSTPQGESALQGEEISRQWLTSAWRLCVRHEGPVFCPAAWPMSRWFCPSQGMRWRMAGTTQWVSGKTWLEFASARQSGSKNSLQPADLLVDESRPPRRLKAAVAAAAQTSTPVVAVELAQDARTPAAPTAQVRTLQDIGKLCRLAAPRKAEAGRPSPRGIGPAHPHPGLGNRTDADHADASHAESCQAAASQAASKQEARTGAPSAVRDEWHAYSALLNGRLPAGRHPRRAQPKRLQRKNHGTVCGGNSRAPGSGFSDARPAVSSGRRHRGRSRTAHCHDPLPRNEPPQAGRACGTRRRTPEEGQFGARSAGSGGPADLMGIARPGNRTVAPDEEPAEAEPPDGEEFRTIQRFHTE